MEYPIVLLFLIWILCNMQSEAARAFSIKVEIITKESFNEEEDYNFSKQGFSYNGINQTNKQILWQYIKWLLATEEKNDKFNDLSSTRLETRSKRNWNYY